jgi:hypothetical protein
MKSVSIILLCLILLSVQAQTSDPPVLFWGSTPCDTYIKNTLNIPASEPCDFLKWKLSLNGVDGGAGTFVAEVLYGEEQPGTNGFRRGGAKLTITGNYQIAEAAKSSPGKTVYALTAPSLKDPLYLVKLNSSLFHIADNEKKLLVGNGGYSYMLNKQ